MTRLAIKYLPLDDVVSALTNDKEHDNESNRASYKRFGMAQSIVRDDRTGRLLAGHGRVETLGAMRDNEELPPDGVELRKGVWYVPVQVGVATKDDEEAEALGIALNAIGEGKWNNNTLADTLARLNKSRGLAGVGFDQSHLERLRARAAERPKAFNRDVDFVPEAKPEPITKPGEVWKLGPHLVMCAKAEDHAAAERLFGKHRAALVFTDPPYGQSYESPSGRFEMIEGDDKRRDDLAKMLVGGLREAVAFTTDRAAFYIWHATSTRDDFTWAMREAGLQEIETLVWAKSLATLGWADYRRSHEPCFYAVKAGHEPLFYGERNSETVWRIAAAGAQGEAGMPLGPGVIVSDGDGAEIYITSRIPKRKLRHVRTTGAGVRIEDQRADGTLWEVARPGNAVHPNQKPVELARRAIANSSAAGEIVLDSYLGSGTTLIAAEQLERRCFGFEMDPVYADVICQRYQEITGTLPIRASTGDAVNFS